MSFHSTEPHDTVQQARAVEVTRALRSEARALGVFHTYQFLRYQHPSLEMPEWDALTEYQQRRIGSAFLIGASSIDLPKLLRDR